MTDKIEEARQELQSSWNVTHARINLLTRLAFEEGKLEAPAELKCLEYAVLKVSAALYDGSSLKSLLSDLKNELENYCDLPF